MKNSNGIRAALQIITRVSELLNAGLKLKEQKTTLRRVLLELANEAPAEILEAVSIALRSPSNVIFADRVRSALEVANSALSLAEHLDSVHVEAVAVNETIDEIVSYAGENRPVQIDGDINWIFDAAIAVWNRRCSPVFTPAQPLVQTDADYTELVSIVEDLNKQTKIRLFCDVTGQSEQMAELMLARSDGFLLGATWTMLSTVASGLTNRVIWNPMMLLIGFVALNLPPAIARILSPSVHGCWQWGQTYFAPLAIGIFLPCWISHSNLKFSHSRVCFTWQWGQLQ